MLPGTLVGFFRSSCAKDVWEVTANLWQCFSGWFQKTAQCLCHPIKPLYYQLVLGDTATWHLEPKRKSKVRAKPTTLPRRNGIMVKEMKTCESQWRECFTSILLKCFLGSNSPSVVWKLCELWGAFMISVHSFFKEHNLIPRALFEDHENETSQSIQSSVWDVNLTTEISAVMIITWQRGKPKERITQVNSHIPASSWG